MTYSNLLAVPPVVVAGPARDLSPMPWPYRVAAVELSVVVPFHSADARLEGALKRISEALNSQGISFEVLALSARPGAGSSPELDRMPHTRVVTSTTIEDKGAALHLGFAMARGAWVCFVDIDEDADVDGYAVIEYFHRAREKNL
ncbi:glycosyltransferase [Couchioplanes azureus]|uniref:glycosyltransferase n=1 Tax=Couchioplanes caeruleus TaxID=56438 RepID=UPI0016702121|nr:glycosyltransferase [Couchioplanes caeruleus]